MVKRVSYRINKPFGVHKEGDKVDIEFSPEGTPLEKEWRRRLKDSVIDNCISKLKIASPKDAVEKDK